VRREAAAGAAATPGAARRGGLASAAAALREMPGEFYRMMAVISLYMLGHINESLLEARAIEVGFGKAESTLVVALLSFMVFLCAVPVGRLDDKFGHRTTFAVGPVRRALGRAGSAAGSAGASPGPRALEALSPGAHRPPPPSPAPPPPPRRWA
jgi:MFS family permease